MFAIESRARARRRGIVLVLILGMLGLLALIGVTFASFAGQSLINARNFGLSEARPNAEQYMDFALAQLINDTNNPLSALRGHSLLRDMYGNDSVQRGTTASEIRGYLDRVSSNTGQLTPLYFTPTTNTINTNASSPFYRMTTLNTNIPTANLSYQYYGLNFTRWILRLTSPGAVAQTFEVLDDDDSSGNYHVLTLSPNDAATGIYVGAGVNGGNPYVGTPIALAAAVANSTPFTLDGRYMRAFNGPGMSRSLVPYAQANTNTMVTPNVVAYPLAPFNVAAYGNFQFNGGFVNPLFPAQVGFPASAFPGDPDAIGMDEDYDACDLENWFLAIQSADGQVVVPSFHRPGVLTAADWNFGLLSSSNTTAQQQQAIAGASKILRPRSIDQSPGFPTDPSTPDANTGKITYDVDNDGDGLTDSVWLDLGYPAQKDVGGKLYKPLFSFMIIGQNGRLPLNTVGNIQGRDWQSIRQYNMATTDPANPAMGVPLYAAPQTWYDAPTWDHTSHLGNSVNEVNPEYALQNAPANVHSANFAASATSQNNTTTTYPYGPVISDHYFSQVDNSGMDVSLTQIRNLLTGTIPQNKLINPSTGSSYNFDSNWVYVNNQLYYMPNNVIDSNDGIIFNSDGSVYSNNNQYNTTTPNNSQVTRGGGLVPAVPGRWGEVEGIPVTLFVPDVFSIITQNPLYSQNTTNIFNSPVRPGRSFYSAVQGNSNFYGVNSSLPTADGNDDDLDSTSTLLGVAAAEYAPVLDGAGQYALASQRLQRFVNPTDPVGVGRMVGFMERPADVNSYGNGYDSNGRVGFFRYFRPGGVPADVSYPVAALGTIPDAYKMSVYSYYNGLSLPARGAIPNRTNNRYHGYEGFRAPTTHRAGPYTPYSTQYGFSDVGGVNAASIAVMGAAPYDIMGISTTVTTGSSSTSTFSVVNAFGNIQLAYGPSTTTGGTTTSYLYTTPTISNSINSESGPSLLGYQNSVTSGSDPATTITTNTTTTPAPYSVVLDQFKNATGVYYGQVVNGFPLGSLNKDEADEMNLYAPNHYDQQFGPSDLEWLYRMHDVDGATLDSRLSRLAPISFLNPADGLLRRRLFSLESWEPNSFVYANDNPQGAFAFNSRFGSLANANFAVMNQVANLPNTSVADPEFYANAFGTEALFNPTLPAPIDSPSPSTPQYYDYYLAKNVNLPVAMNGTVINPLTYLNPTASSSMTNFFVNSKPVTQLSNANHSDNFSRPVPSAITTAAPTITPSVAHRDRRINLNFPFPVVNDPGEPVRQKWIRETYQFLKATLPPQSVDTPQELAALSQYVVNIVDFRDTDCTTTRFVNTDLMVIPPVAASAGPPAVVGSPSGVQFSTIPFPGTGRSTQPAAVDPNPPWDPNAVGSKASHTFTPFDPQIAYEQTAPGSGSNWLTVTQDANGNQQPPYLVQYGMEYSPIALNEVLCYTFNCQPSLTFPALPPATNPTVPPATPPSTTPTTVAANSQTTRFYIELVNTLTDENSHAVGGTGSADLDLRGWDFVIMPDSDPQGRPDPITGCIMANAGGIAMSAPTGAGPMNLTDNMGNVTGAGGTTTLPTTGGMFPTTAVGWGIGQTGLRNAAGANNRVPPIRSSASPTNPAPTYYVIGNPVYTSTTAPIITAQSSVDPVPIMPTASLNAVMPRGFLPIAPSPSATPPAVGTGNYYWLYLRRPANPFNENGEMVVVDCMRFPWAADLATGMITAKTSTTTGTGTTTTSTFSVGTQTNSTSSKIAIPTTPTTTAQTQLFSADRDQPYKGGHLVPAPFPNPPYAYGYSEQTVPSSTGMLANYSRITGAVGGATSGAGYWVNTTSSTTTNPMGITTTNPPTYAAVQMTKSIIETIGYQPNSPDGGGTIPNWDYIPMHDRDFTSVAELMLVPGCPPGLFTKQFAELAYTDTPTIPSPAPPYTSINLGNTPASAGPPPVTAVGQSVPTASPAFVLGVPHSYPYLVDKFFYTAASVANNVNDSNMTPSMYPSQVGGWTGTGWHKMFDFFEVPSSANGAIGTADNGENFDWARSDRRPGLINLNLIVDEEVFFGVLDDPRLNLALAYYYNGLNTVLPQIVSQIDANGWPVNKVSGASYNGFYNISDPNQITTTYLAPGQMYSTLNNPSGLSPMKYPSTTTTGGVTVNLPSVGRGFTYGDPTVSGLGLSGTQGINPNTGFAQTTITGMKGAFIDFLKLRHGGSNFLFGHGTGGVQDGSVVPNTNTATPGFNLPEERPYHSLSYPDINYTIMRPAYLPPSAFTNIPPNPATATLHQYGSAAPYYPFNDPGASSRALDPGVRLPWLDQNFNTGATTATMPTTAAWVPPIPPRRLFQIPDYYEGTYMTTTPAGTNNPSNASLSGDPTINLVNPNLNMAYTSGSTQGTVPFNSLTQASGNSLFPAEPQYGAAPIPANVATIVSGYPVGTNLPTTPNPSGNPYNQSPFLNLNTYLGANSTTGASPISDRREHPHYRTEMLQKVMNLTTVRTHQFAVWITVGFFEVTKAGVPELTQPDILGAELNAASGRSIRYRSFFTIDRTKATGFNPYYPGEFRDCVTYRRRIE